MDKYQQFLKDFIDACESRQFEGGISSFRKLLDFKERAEEILKIEENPSIDVTFKCQCGAPSNIMFRILMSMEYKFDTEDSEKYKVEDYFVKSMCYSDLVLIQENPKIKKFLDEGKITILSCF